MVHSNSFFPIINKFYNRIFLWKSVLKKIVTAVASPVLLLDVLISLKFIIQTIVLLVIWIFYFYGAVLIEKILRTVPDVGRIFVMIKGKDKDAVQSRLKNEVWAFGFSCLIIFGSK